ncbi:MAG: hypothetical protein GXC94_02005 [Comamonadaceae bacterium]|jgi:hypothetical protein|nr:hypothetical protein [Comamonadaceae bacterium]
MKFVYSEGLYGTRPPGHRALYHRKPGWLFIEWGDKTLEVDYDETFFPRLLAALPRPFSTHKESAK